MNTLALSHEPVVLSLKVTDIAESEWPGLLDCLSPDEKKRANAFHHVADRRSFIAAHALLRLSLAPVLGVAPAAMNFTANAYGKPGFPPGHAHADLGFNISHSRGMVAAGIARGLAIGVDTEPLDRVTTRDMEAISRWLAPDERSRLAACSDAERAARLLDLWTLKEAVIKATGRGLSLELSSFSVDPDRLSLTGLDGPWRLERRTHDGHRVAVALLGGSPLPLRHCKVAVVDGAANLKMLAE